MVWSQGYDDYIHAEHMYSMSKVQVALTVIVHVVHSTGTVDMFALAADAP